MLNSISGIHITRPFHLLLIDPDTNYSTLLAAFKQLYQDLTTIKADRFLTTDEQVCTFVSSKIFKESLPEKCLLDTLKESTQMYQSEVEKLLGLALKMFAEGFDHQKGAIFGFGPSAEKETGSVLKISTVDEDTLGKMDRYVPVHNLGEERNVGMVNHELNIRGKQHLKTVSRKIVINR